MSRNGTPKLYTLEEMPDDQLQIIAVKAFSVLAERWEKPIDELIWECYMEIKEEVDEAQAS